MGLAGRGPWTLGKWPRRGPGRGGMPQFTRGFDASVVTRGFETNPNVGRVAQRGSGRSSVVSRGFEMKPNVGRVAGGVDEKLNVGRVATLWKGQQLATL